MKDKKITIYGNRLKSEAQKRGYTNDKMAELLNYSCGKQISPIYSGTHKLSDDRFKILSEEWGLREEYLRCLDDWETDSDMWDAFHNSDLEEFRKAIEYLKTIGLSLEPGIFWLTSKKGLYNDFHSLEKYVTKSGKQYVHSIIDFSKSKDQADILYSDDDYNEFVEMRSLPEGISKNTSLDKMIDPSDITKESVVTVYTEIDGNMFGLLFRVKYKNKFKGFMQPANVSIYLKHIDALCKASIESLLIAGAIPFESYADDSIPFEA